MLLQWDPVSYDKELDNFQRIVIFYTISDFAASFTACEYLLYKVTRRGI